MKLQSFSRLEHQGSAIKARGVWSKLERRVLFCFAEPVNFWTGLPRWLTIVLCLSGITSGTLDDSMAANAPGRRTGKVAPIRADPSNLRAEVAEFLEMYNRILQRLSTVSSEAAWKAGTDVTEEHTGQRIGAEGALAAFVGNPYIIERTRAFLRSEPQLDELSVRQLKMILYNASSYPGTIAEVVSARVAAEAKQSAILDGFKFIYTPPGETNARPITPNQIEQILTTSTNLPERKRVWETSKQTGPALKAGLVELRQLRNRVAQEMGFSSFFSLQVSSYEMSVREMKELTERLNRDIRPLYEQLHCWARHKLAERYSQSPPQLIPAHWIGNRWAQSWPGIVEGVNLDAAFTNQSPQWIIEQAERFYVSLGWPELPKTFWSKSDLYELPADSKRRKNTHASAWHVDYGQDVRSLMSVKANYDWFGTTHHELGHVYYFLAYARPEVPVVLREGANRAFHEGIGDLIGIAAGQIPYLKEIGTVPKELKIDQTQWLLNEALDHVVFIPFSAGVMTSWEHDLYEENLPPNEFNKRWWGYVTKFQGIAPPEPRGEEFCDAATKTHINDDAAQYYDYALAHAIKYQLHLHIAKKILKQDPRHCSYFGNKEVGKFLDGILKSGATQDWRKVLKEATGEEISARGMLEYFEPVMTYLQEQNKGKSVGW